MIIGVMGVAGSGKTTIGSQLANAIGATFVDADAFHSPANIKKMSRGIPLTDADRAPWLAALHQRLVRASESGEVLVLACSALKQDYRDILSTGITVLWVYLKGTREEIYRRLQQRQHHFISAGMLGSQFATLEEPHDAIVIDALVSPSQAVQTILDALRGKGKLPDQVIG
jgi:gluconokinase